MIEQSLKTGEPLCGVDQDIERLVRDVIVRTNFVPTVRHFIGWRGIKEVSRTRTGWTVKIRGYAGIFGLGFEKACRTADGRAVRFALFYFPGPEEGLLEKFSLMANHLAQQEDYIPLIRSFPEHPDFTHYFSIGHLTMGVNADENCLLCIQENPSAKRSIIEAGICLPDNGTLVQLVAPGASDEDIPAFSLASGFVDVFLASVAFHFGSLPTVLHHDQRPGRQMVIAPDGRRKLQTRPGIYAERFIAGFGAARDVFSGMAAMAPTERRTIRNQWREGQPVPEVWREAGWWQATKIPLQQTIDKTFLGVDERPALMILTGFLGSGKTSFLRRFIEYQTSRHRFVAVIQNEIGATGLDEKLIEDHFTVAEIDEGCVCCTLAGNLKTAVQSIRSQFRPDFVVLETTGLANPYNLLDDMIDLQEMVRFDSVTTMVDISNVDHAVERSAVALEQIRAADVLLLNKIDRVDDTAVDRAVARLASINPRAPVVACCHGDVHPGLLYSVDPLENNSVENDSVENDPAKERLSAKSLEARGVPTHLDDGITHHCVTLTRPLERSRFIRFVEEGLPETVLRAKGVVQFSDKDAPDVFQYVRGRFEISDLEDQCFEKRFLVFIGKKIDPAYFEEGCRQSYTL